MQSNSGRMAGCPVAVRTALARRASDGRRGMKMQTRARALHPRMKMPLRARALHEATASEMSEKTLCQRCMACVQTTDGTVSRYLKCRSVQGRTHPLPKTAQEAPKAAPETPQEGPESVTKVPKTTLRRRKTRPIWLKKARRWPLDGPKRGGANRKSEPPAPEAPMKPQEAPRCPQEVPKRLPRRPKKPPRNSKDAPKKPQDGP